MFRRKTHFSWTKHSLTHYEPNSLFSSNNTSLIILYRWMKCYIGMDWKIIDITDHAIHWILIQLIFSHTSLSLNRCIDQCFNKIKAIDLSVWKKNWTNETKNYIVRISNNLRWAISTNRRDTRKKKTTTHNQRTGNFINKSAPNDVGKCLILLIKP